MHIIIHTQYYPPELGAPQARLSELAEGLARRGFEVTILTAMPSYPRGKIFAGYGGIFRVEKQEHTRLIRTFIFPTQSPRLIPRLVNYFSFVFSSLFGGILFIGSADFILTESPPLFLGITGYLLSRLKRARWIFNVSDLWPESAVHLGAISDGWALKISSLLEQFCYRKAWLVTGQSKSILENIQSRFPGLYLYHLSNGVNTELFVPQAPDEPLRHLYAPNGEVLLIYAGLHGLAQGLDQILLSAKQIQEGGIRTIRFLLVGDGPDKKRLLQLAAEWKLDNVSFIDPISKEKIPSLVSCADIWIVPLKMYIPGAVPSKLYEGMASGKPVILIAEGEAADIVNSSQAGIVVKPGNINALTDAILTMCADRSRRQAYGNAGRQTVLRNYDRRKIIEKFAGLLDNPSLVLNSTPFQNR